jgi:hypothetical protein
VATGSNIFAGTADGLYVSTNYGANWTLKNEGFDSPAPSIVSLCLEYNAVLAGTANNGIWKRPLSDFIGIRVISSEVPDKYSLYQNYPNPFNPSTNIRYQITNSNSNGLVVLKVYDVLGKEVTTLVNEKQSPGIYEATFDGSNLSSGVYFYKLSAGDFSQIRKMTLVK